MKKNADRYVTATYCDDIRQEVGNKMSLMGCYQGELHVQSAPSALPKLCAYVSVTTVKERPFKSLSIRVLQDDTELALLEIPEAGLRDAPRNLDDTSTLITVSTALMFAPFVIETPGSLRIVVTSEEGELIGPRLLIKVATPTFPTVLTAEEPKPATVSAATRKPTRKKTAKLA